MTGARRGAAVLGSPIAHSLSPVLHRAAYDELGLTGWTYRAVECDEPALAETLRGLDREGLAGVSLTMPLKRAVLPLLTRTERLADDVGAANTVLFGGIEGEWYGANTDVLGMVAALSAVGVRPARDDEAWVLGGGATAASALAALAQLGVRDVVVAARRPDAVAPLVTRAAGWGLTVEVRPWAQAPGCVAAPLTVATTPAGATDDVAAELVDRPRTGSSEPHGVLLDVVYAPWPTRLAAAWQRIGGEVVGGLALLVGQAAEQVRLMTGREPPVAAMQAAGRVALAVRP